MTEFICIPFSLYISGETDQSDQSGQPESLYIGAGIGVGVVIILLVIVIIAIVVWWKRVQTQKIRQR